MQAYGGANLVPIAAPEICCLISLLNSKKLLLRTNSANLTRSLAGIFEVCASYLVFNVKIPSFCCMLGHRPTTSALCIKDFKRKLRNSDSFSVGVPQLEIMGLPGTL